jgi:hypothetical protein
MRGMEDEDTPAYALEDLKEVFLPRNRPNHSLKVLTQSTATDLLLLDTHELISHI